MLIFIGLGVGHIEWILRWRVTRCSCAIGDRVIARALSQSPYQCIRIICFVSDHHVTNVTGQVIYSLVNCGALLVSNSELI